MSDRESTGQGTFGTSPPGPPRLSSSVSDHVIEMLEQSARLGLLGPMPVAAQLNHSLGFVAAVRSTGIGEPGKILDLGTGAGIPGVVLADCWPSSEIVLVDSNQRRTEFLQSQVAEWKRRPQIQVVRERAEVLGRSPLFREKFDVVTARSFGGPAVTTECGAPLVAVGGVLVVSEPPGGEPRWPEGELQEFGLETRELFRSDSAYNYQVLMKVRPTSERYPRRTGLPAKRPLF
jgi:16S rRNA (guanine527-N7)-methyltransferase